MSEITSLQTVIKDLQTQVAALEERLAIVDCKHEWFAACGPDMQGIKTCNKCGYQPTRENVTKAGGEDMSDLTPAQIAVAIKEAQIYLKQFNNPEKIWASDLCIAIKSLQAQVAVLEAALNDVLYSGDMSECKVIAEAALKQEDKS